MRYSSKTLDYPEHPFLVQAGEGNIYHKLVRSQTFIISLFSPFLLFAALIFKISFPFPKSLDSKSRWMAGVMSTWPRVKRCTGGTGKHRCPWLSLGTCRSATCASMCSELLQDSSEILCMKHLEPSEAPWEGTAALTASAGPVHLVQFKFKTVWYWHTDTHTDIIRE